MSYPNNLDLDKPFDGDGVRLRILKILQGWIASGGVPTTGGGGGASTSQGLAVDPTAPPSYTPGTNDTFSLDKNNGSALVNNRLLTTADVVTNTPVASTLVSSTAYEASHVLKASAGRLFTLNGYNSKGSAQFIQIFNSATVPADTAVPIAVITAPATGNFSIDFGPLGIPLSSGISVSNSSTGPAKTIGSGDCFFTASVL